MTQAAEMSDAQGRLTEVRRLSPRVLGLIIDAGPGFSWEAGQHLCLRDPEGARADAYYSIASALDPGAPGRFELAVLEESYGYPEEPGSTLHIRGPYGSFVFQPFPRTGTLVLIGMGTGVAPLRAVLQAVRRDPDFQLSVILVQGARNRHECLYYSEFLSLQDDSFSYRPVFSREEGAPKRVQDLVGDLPQDAHFILCGSQEMTVDVEARLRARAVPAHRIAREGY